MAQNPFRLLLVGTQGDLALLQEPLKAAAVSFEVDVAEAEGTGDAAIEAMAAPDVTVIGPTVESPLPIARQLRALRPKSQIIFLLPPERLDRFRAGLPFVPHLASAWTASTASDPAGLATLLSDAAHASRERTATATVLGRINQQLAVRKAAPEQVRRSQLALSERYLATILTQSPDAFIAVGPDGSIIAHNDAATRLFGEALDSPHPVRVSELVPGNERERLQAIIGTARRGEAVASFEIEVKRPRARRSYLELSLAPVQDEAGLIASVSITARDITERKRAEERQRLLINELNHRVKNTLAIVQALAQQSFKGKSPAPDERSAFEARLATLSAAHDLLTRQSWKSATLKETIEASAGAACGADGSRLAVEGPEISRPPRLRFRSRWRFTSFAPTRSNTACSPMRRARSISTGRSGRSPKACGCGSSGSKKGGLL